MIYLKPMFVKDELMEMIEYNNEKYGLDRVIVSNENNKNEGV